MFNDCQGNSDYTIGKIHIYNLIGVNNYPYIKEPLTNRNNKKTQLTEIIINTLSEITNTIITDRMIDVFTNYISENTNNGMTDKITDKLTDTMTNEVIAKLTDKIIEYHL